MQEHARTCLSPKLTQNQNFFCGGRGVAVRKMQNNGVRKLQNIGLLWAKVRMFASKKSDVFVFLKRGEVLNTDYFVLCRRNMTLVNGKASKGKLISGTRNLRSSHIICEGKRGKRCISVAILHTCEHPKICSDEKIFKVSCEK